MSFYNQITQKSIQFSLLALFNKFLPPRSHEDCSKPSAIVCLQRTLLKISHKNKKTGSRACLNDNPAVFIRKSIPLLCSAFSQDHAHSTDWVFSCRSPGRLCHRHLQAECLQRTLLKISHKNKKTGSCACLDGNPAVFYLPGPSPAKYFRR